MATHIEPICTGCQRHPDEIPEYIEQSMNLDITPDKFVRREEGTYNRENGHFLCTECYIKAGMPSTERGWYAS